MGCNLSFAKAEWWVLLSKYAPPAFNIFDIGVTQASISFRELSFFTGRGAPENWGDQVFFLRSKGGIKRFFQIKKGGSKDFLKK